MSESQFKKSQAIDIDGEEVISPVLLKLLNSFPGLNGKQILFSTLSDSSGIGFFPTSGAVILSDTEDITGHVKQTCLYPFSVIYRVAPASETQKIRIKEFLDGIGKWLERQPIVINNETVQIKDYPALFKNRKIKSINRTSPSHLNAVYNDGIEDWIISISLKYECEFDK